jgi:HNH endonuclease
MAFSESIKLKVKEAAAFRCCRCQHTGVEVHHIIPEKDKGPDTLDNAAPLCPSCHSEFGDNPVKRKEITQMRDWWYERVAQMFGPLPGSLVAYFSRIDTLVSESGENSAKLDELKAELRAYSARVIDAIIPQTSRSVASEVLELIPLDSGYWLNRADIAFEGLCQCERVACVDHSSKVYCYFPKWLSTWVLNKQLYWRCYDEIVQCPKCGKQHKRGHIGRKDVCHPHSYRGEIQSPNPGHQADG